MKLVIVLRNRSGTAKEFEVVKVLDDHLFKVKGYNGGLLDTEFGIKNTGPDGHYQFDKLRLKGRNG